MMKINLINEAFDILKKYNCLGEKYLDNGSLLIARAPHIASQAWLHCIFAPMKDKEISLFEVDLNQDIPKVYKEFLLESNGLSVFNTTFSLFGKRTNDKRTDDDVWQPFSLILPNTIEKPNNADKNIFIIGCYDWDGSYVYIDKRDDTIHLCQRDDATSLFEWDNFENMLLSEIERLTNLFDEKGVERDITKSTLPTEK